jgi:low affinity Fe/Cu permease
MRKRFSHFALWASRVLGSPYAFLSAVALIAVWVASGPCFGFSDTWQLVVNTGTTVITFLSVFLIQNTQNREAIAMQLKLDELIRALAKANNGMIDLEDLSEEELEKLRKRFQEFCKKSRAGKRSGRAPSNSRA